MSLNFDFSDMIKRVGQERYEELTTSPFEAADGERKWHPVTNALLWTAIGVDLGEITEKNVDEWWFRVRMLQLTSPGNYRNGDGQPDLIGGNGEAFITRADIENHIGMSTNVPTKPRKDWLKRVFGGDLVLLPKMTTQTKTAHELCAEMAKA